MNLVLRSYFRQDRKFTLQNIFLKSKTLSPPPAEKSPAMQLITIPEIQKLFKQKLKLKPTRTGVYYYIYRYKFPRPLRKKRGYVKVWNARTVKKWFTKHRNAMV